MLFAGQEYQVSLKVTPKFLVRCAIGTWDAGSLNASPGDQAAAVLRGLRSNRKPNTKMRNYSKTVGALAAASALVAGYASAEIEGEIHVGYSNMYEFRFVDLGQDLVEAGVNLSTEVGGGFSLNAGTWYASTNDSNAGSFNELDLYAGVSKEFGPVTLEGGYIFYHFLDTEGIDTQEVYLRATTEVAYGIGVGATFYYDFDSNNGWYLQPEVTKSFELNECLSLNLAAGVGIADGHDLQVKDTFTGSLDGFQGWFVSASLPWEFREGVTLTPYVKYTDADSELVTDAPGLGSSGKEYVIAGVKLSVGF